MVLFNDEEIFAVLCDNNVDTELGREFVVDLLLEANRRGSVPTTVVVSEKIFHSLHQPVQGDNVILRLDTGKGDVLVSRFERYVIVT